MQSEEKSKKGKFVYFIVPAPLGISPGQRFRFEHYLPLLGDEQIKFRISSFYSAKGWGLLYKTGKHLQKLLIVMRGFFKRAIDLFRVIPFDYVYVYREAAPVGPPVFEWIIAKVFRKKIIYDFDDAIWIPVTSSQNKAAKYFKWFSKISSICRMSSVVTVGNEYLAGFAGKFSSNVIIIPTVVNTGEVHNVFQTHKTGTPVVGWTGTFSTLKYLEIVLPALQRLQEKIDFTFIVIADKDPLIPLKKYKFIPWRKDSEISDLLRMHIGLMPLYDSEIEKGKCGFKAIQYMSLGIPAVVSPVGVNAEIVLHEKNGFVATTETEWEKAIEKLLTDPELRQQFGEESRKKIETEFSVKATQHLFIKLFS